MNRLTRWFAIVLLAFACSARSETQADAIVGVWLTEQADSKIEITKAGRGYAGKVVWLKEVDPQPTDEKNADPALRTRRIMGLDVLSAIVYAGEGAWRATLYSPRKGRSYPAELSLAGGKLIVKAKDGIFSKTVAWTRTK
jgi:uncharacterized protein (DUF2147 family)